MDKLLRFQSWNESRLRRDTRVSWQDHAFLPITANYTARPSVQAENWTRIVMVSYRWVRKSYQTFEVASHTRRSGPFVSFAHTFTTFRYPLFAFEHGVWWTSSELQTDLSTPYIYVCCPLCYFYLFSPFPHRRSSANARDIDCLRGVQFVLVLTFLPILSGISIWSSRSVWKLKIKYSLFWIE